MAIFIISAVLIAACFIFAAISILGNISDARQRALQYVKVVIRFGRFHHLINWKVFSQKSKVKKAEIG